MSNTIVSLLLCAVLKVIKPELEPSPVYTIVFASAIIDCARLISWINDWRIK